MMSSPDIITLNNVRRTFGSGHTFSWRPRIVKAVDGISFSVRRGETFGIVGESGSGKSTTARMICGLERFDSGSIIVDGIDVGRLRRGDRLKFRKILQLVFQDPYAALNPHWKVGDLIAEGMRVHGIGDRRERRKRVLALLDQCGLPSDAANRYPFEFSGGQRQRICIARALAVEPRILVLDEPVSALDVSIQAQILILLQTLQRELGLTYVFISHNLAVVEQLCDRLIVMKSGRIVETGPTEEVIHYPSHEYTRTLVEATPIPEPSRRRRPAHV